MSLFATDPALLVAPRSPVEVGTPSPDAIAADLLPQLVQDALARGHVRTAALLFERALDQLDLRHPAMVRARQALDACSAHDTARQQRLLSGEALVIPSLAHDPTGAPRFLLGVTWEELALPCVQRTLRNETTDGHQPELRNFLDEALLDGDAVVDLDPEAGVLALSAAALTSGPITVHVTDPAQRTLLERNLHAGLHAARAHVVEAMAEALAGVGHTRTLLHLGAHPLACVERHLAVWRAAPVTIAWDATTPDAALTAEALASHGFASFVLAHLDDADGPDAVALHPWQPALGAATAFAMSPVVVAALEGA